jgi:hypothetical protein
VRGVGPLWLSTVSPLSCGFPIFSGLTAIAESALTFQGVLATLRLPRSRYSVGRAVEAVVEEVHEPWSGAELAERY